MEHDMMVLESRLEFALPAGEKQRLNCIVTKDGTLEAILDVHGLKCVQVRKIINNMLNLARQRLCLAVIHGFNHGTAIKDMLPSMDNPHIVSTACDANNPGKTYIMIA